MLLLTLWSFLKPVTKAIWCNQETDKWTMNNMIIYLFILQILEFIMVNPHCLTSRWGSKISYLFSFLFFFYYILVSFPCCYGFSSSFLSLNPKRLKFQPTYLIETIVLEHHTLVLISKQSIWPEDAYYFWSGIIYATMIKGYNF